MTIAACFVTPEGVVFGADSTTTAGTAFGPHYYDHSQKIFEIGAAGNYAALIWGLGGLPGTSYRRQFALLGDKLAQTPPVSVEGVVKTWTEDFWHVYDSSELVKTCRDLGKKSAFIAGITDPNARTQKEETAYENFKINLVAGFCIGGYANDRRPLAYSVIFEPLAARPAYREVEGWSFWGTPHIVQRLIFGCDDNLKTDILNSGKWTGTVDELNELLAQHQYGHPIVLPMRDAVDFVHSAISTTIKTLKFSNLSQTCGGPIELGVITADRNFRWVRHKSWDSAISEGGT